MLGAEAGEDAGGESEGAEPGTVRWIPAGVLAGAAPSRRSMLDPSEVEEKMLPGTTRSSLL